MPHSTTASTTTTTTSTTPSNSSRDPASTTASPRSTRNETTPSSTHSHRTTSTATPAPAKNIHAPHGPPKRTTVPLADGWTLVSTTRTHNPKNKKKNNSSRAAANMPAGSGYSGLSPAGLRAAHEPAGPARIMPGTSKERLLERLAKFRERWLECGCRVGIRGVLGGTGAPEESEGEGKAEGYGTGEGEGLRIKNAVCIGLGSLSVDNVAAGVRSMWQLVCFLDVVEMLGASTLYAEDPVFNALDEEVLAELGVQVVQGRRSADGSRQEGAAQFIERESFVFAPFMPSFMVLEDFLAERNPAVYIGNDVQATLELARSQVRYSGDVDERTRRCIRVAEEFLAQGREVVTLPEFDLHEHALAGQMIYWRKPAGE